MLFCYVFKKVRALIELTRKETKLQKKKKAVDTAAGAASIIKQHKLNNLTLLIQSTVE